MKYDINDVNVNIEKEIDLRTFLFIFRGNLITNRLKCSRMNYKNNKNALWIGVASFEEDTAESRTPITSSECSAKLTRISSCLFFAVPVAAMNCFIVNII